MNELSNFLVESILGEADSVSNKVVVYSGRFQPFHRGHYATYSHLVKKFGKENVFIGTSNKTDNKKSPFNFKEKKQIMTTMFGVPSNKIVEVKNPYVPTEVLKKFDKDTTSFITVVGKKDASRLGGKFFTPYKDNLDFEGYEDRGYVYIAPQQSNPISGTDVRLGLGSGSDEDKKEFFVKKAYPKFNDKIFNLITKKLSKMSEGRIFISKEQIEEWIVQNMDLIEEATTTMGRTAVDDGPNYIYPNFNAFDKVSKSSNSIPSWCCW
jgi:glycerol-3-phosphate cytidylyltransferase-like family protein